MTNGPTQQGLTPQDFHAARAEITTEGVKGLFLMNGGGSIALLAFLQAIWEKQPQLAKFVLAGIAVMCLGLVLGGFINFFRYHASFNFPDANGICGHSLSPPIEEAIKRLCNQLA